LVLGGFVRRLGLLCWALAALGAASARAQEAPPAEAPPDQATLDARRHFKAGTKLYRDGNYGGALAEFEEAYRLKPGAGSLQNVALSQKGLFRYAEAAASLQQLLQRHAAELSESERRAVEEALSELTGLVASIKLRVSPDSARVVLDGRQLAPSEWQAPLVLNVGEHTLSVDAPGYAPEKRLLRVPGGQRDVPVEVSLKCVSGFVEVTSNDPTANIAIDGLPKARRAYKGPVEPDTDHLLQVYREGVDTFEQTFQVGLCKTVAIDAQLEGLDSAPPGPSDTSGALPGAPPRRVQRGFFGMLSLDLLGLSRQPLDLQLNKASSGGVLGALGLRAGYRISNPVALDLRLDLGALEVTGASDGDVQRDYSLRSIHFGPDLKLMTTGEKLRFVTTVGAGVVHHRLAVAANGIYPSAAVRGLDPYFVLELGLGFNYRQFLGEIGLIARIDGTAALQKGFSDDLNRHLTKDLGTTLPMVGIGLRGGFSQWRPAR
jgi:hypothetical protein